MQGYIIKAILLVSNNLSLILRVHDAQVTSQLIIVIPIEIVADKVMANYPNGGHGRQDLNITSYPNRTMSIEKILINRIPTFY